MNTLSQEKVKIIDQNNVSDKSAISDAMTLVNFGTHLIYCITYGI